MILRKENEFELRVLIGTVIGTISYVGFLINSLSDVNSEDLMVKTDIQRKRAKDLYDFRCFIQLLMRKWNILLKR